MNMKEGYVGSLGCQVKGGHKEGKGGNRSENRGKR